MHFDVALVGGRFNPRTGLIDANFSLIRMSLERPFAFAYADTPAFCLDQNTIGITDRNIAAARVGDVHVAMCIGDADFAAGGFRLHVATHHSGIDRAMLGSELGVSSDVTDTEIAFAAKFGAASDIACFDGS